jgi:hypothetical protein
MLTIRSWGSKPVHSTRSAPTLARRLFEVLAIMSLHVFAANAAPAPGGVGDCDRESPEMQDHRMPDGTLIRIPKLKVGMTKEGRA